MLTVRRRLWSQEITNPQKRLDALLEESVTVLELSIRITNALEVENIITIQNLLDCDPLRILQIRNFGVKTLLAIYAALRAIGFKVPTPSKERLAELQLDAALDASPKLSAAAALERCVEDLWTVLDVVTQLHGCDSAVVGYISWVLQRADSRRPEQPA